MTDQIFLHIGYPKTASSLLQLKLFNEHPDINYLGLRGGNPHLDQKIRNVINRSSILQFQPYELTALIDKEVSASNKNVHVVSSQGFATTVCTDPVTVCKRLRKIFGNAQIIVCIRNQVDWITSTYHEKTKQGASRLYTPFSMPGHNPKKMLSLEEWFDYRRSIDDFLPLIKQLDFWPLINNYRKVFGAENVHVLTYELLKKDPKQFITSICKILGIEEEKLSTNIGLEYVNKRRSSSELKLESIANKYPLLTGGLKTIIPSPIRKVIREMNIFDKSERPNGLNEGQIAFIVDYCKPGNRELMSKCKLNLDELGYPV